MKLRHLSIKQISYKLAWFIANHQNESHSKKYIYYYSLQAIIGETVKSTIILLIMSMFGLLNETLICMIVFSSIRAFAGGFHANSNFKCFLYTLLIIIISCFSSIYISTKFQNTTLHYILSIICIYSAILFISLAPKEIINKPIISCTYRKKLKFKAIFIYLIWIVVSIVSAYSNNYTYASIIIIASFFEAITLTDWFHKNALLIEKNLCLIFT